MAEEKPPSSFRNFQPPSPSTKSRIGKPVRLFSCGEETRLEEARPKNNEAIIGTSSNEPLEHFDEFYSRDDGNVAAVFNRQAFLFWMYLAWWLETAATFCGYTFSENALEAKLPASKAVVQFVWEIVFDYPAHAVPAEPT